VSERDERLSRRDAVGGLAAGLGALALPRFLEPGDALAASPEGRAEALALFLGQDELPVPPADAKVHTSACQYCNVGCGY
jgi:anaerobic selenocysteine-containing dehydrogenase